MAGDGPRDLRDELASLRIDRGRGRPPRSGRGRVAALLAVVALALLGGAALYWRTLGRPLEVQVAYAERSEPGAAAASGPVLSGSGYVVTGDKYISIGVRVAGRIDAYLVDESDHVVKGQPLVRLDDRDYRAALARARAGLARAEANIALRRQGDRAHPEPAPRGRGLPGGARREGERAARWPRPRRASSAPRSTRPRSTSTTPCCARRWTA